MHCSKCDPSIPENYCTICGQPQTLKRIDAGYLLHEINHVLHLERGFFYTVRELLLRPGVNVKRFLHKERSRVVKPILFLLITSIIYSIVVSFFHINVLTETQQTDIQKMKVTSAMLRWIQTNVGYANLIIAIVVSFWIKLFFRKSQYNIFEIQILLCFTFGMTMLFYAVGAFIKGMTNWSSPQLENLLGIAFSTWAIGNFFYEKGKIAAYIKAFFAYTLGMLTFITLVTILGISIDLLIA